MRGALGWGLLAVGLITAGPAHAQKFTKPDPELIALVQQAEDDKSDFADKYTQQVWLTDMSLRLADIVPDPDERLKLLKMIHSEANRAQLPPQLVLALIQVESKFDPYAVSHSGAVGLMQIMPFWLKLIGRADDSLVHAKTNLRMGCTILKYYLGKSHGDIREALQRYNGATVGIDYSDSVLKALSRKWAWN
ncbi:MAG TPA: transglycosylase SLT domain-containing protein [Gammaproteobacteria bacterium]|jgi:soluble lytic murein transglycosylase-like protein|nr:transglycosylase SLT domain-containing protein [Gammaproteobacteria bacterium]